MTGNTRELIRRFGCPDFDKLYDIMDVSTKKKKKKESLEKKIIDIFPVLLFFNLSCIFCFIDGLSLFRFMVVFRKGVGKKKKKKKKNMYPTPSESYYG